MKKKLLIGLIGLACITTIASAKTIKIGTGGVTGNYYGMVQDLLREDYCGNALGTDRNGEKNVGEIISGTGSVKNLKGLITKKMAIGIVQADVLFSTKKRTPRKVNEKKLKVIAELHPETFHLLIPKNFKPKNQSSNSSLWGNIMKKVGVSKKRQVAKKISLNSLRGETIASWGGSSVSASALSQFFKLNWNVKNIPEGERKGLTGIPILLVGGAPYAPVQEYLDSGNYTLVGIDHSKIAEKAPFYIKMNANYEVNGNPLFVPSIGVRAILLGKTYRSKKREKVMHEFSKCVMDVLPDLADDDETNSNWSVVYDLNEQDSSSMNWATFPID